MELDSHPATSIWHKPSQGQAATGCRYVGAKTTAMTQVSSCWYRGETEWRGTSLACSLCGV